jgi:hypothetical protein
MTCATHSHFTKPKSVCGQEGSTEYESSLSCVVFCTNFFMLWLSFEYPRSHSGRFWPIGLFKVS